jgi:probable phosphoglycerate mutase
MSTPSTPLHLYLIRRGETEWSLTGQPDWNVFRDGFPHGEMPAQVSEGADRLIASLRKLEGKVALFSHSQFGGVLAARWIALPLAQARHFPLGTASLSIFSFNPQHPDVPVIALWDADPHDPFDPAPKVSLSP